MPTTTLTKRSSLTPEAIFGGFDGMTSVYGVLVGLLAHSGTGVFAAVLGLAVASSLGMAGGQYQSDDDHSIPAAVVMGAATFVGTLVPALGFVFLPHVWAIVWMVVSCLTLTGLIAYQRHAWIRSYLWFVVVAGVTLAVSLLTPGGAG